VGQQAAERKGKGLGKRVHEERREGKSHEHAGKRDHVGDDLMVQVYERDDDQRRAKRHDQEGLAAESELPEYPDVEQGVGELHDGISPGNGFAAAPAPAAKDEKADEGDVVVPLDPLPAPDTVGRRGDNGPAPRQPHDADVEEASHDEAEDKEEDVHHMPSSPVSIRSAL
jgi:hypothetical protein